MMEAWKHHRAVGNIVVGSLVGLFLVLLLANIARTGEVVQAIRTTQQSNTSLAQANTDVLRRVARLSNRIHSCTTPGRPCANRSARATATAVNTISARNAHTSAIAASAAAACSLNHSGYKAIYACVRQRLATDQHRRNR